MEKAHGPFVTEEAFLEFIDDVVHEKNVNTLRIVPLDSWVSETFGLLHYACAHNMFVAMKRLCDLGADCNQRNSHKDSWTPLCYSSRYGTNEEFEYMLSKKDIDVTALIGDGETIFPITVRGNDIRKSQLLLDHFHGFVYLTDHSGKTALLSAVEIGLNDNMLRLLLQAGSDPNHCNHDGINPLGRTITYRMTYASLLLLYYGAKWPKNTTTYEDLDVKKDELFRYRKAARVILGLKTTMVKDLRVTLVKYLCNANKIIN